jgi:uncharacterized PurR-regulated membrane protein YhhQ (DUF165 family)
MNRKTLVSFTAFAASVLAANWMTARWGLVSVAGVSFTAGTLAAGLGFGLRDACHEAGGWRVAVAAILTGAALSYFVSPSLAVASAVAFLLSELADLAVYQPLRRRRWVLAVVASNLLGALIDTVVFLHLAGFPIRDAIAGQMLAKAAMILPAIPAVRWARGRR